MSQASETETTEGTGRIKSVSGPVVKAVDLDARMNDVVYVGDEGLMGEVIEIEGDVTTIQVYEETSGVAPREPVENTGEPLSVDLGPGMLDAIYDGVQRPLDVLEEKMDSAFLDRGVDAPGIDLEKQWEFTPEVEAGDSVEAGDVVGVVPETVTIDLGAFEYEAGVADLQAELERVAGDVAVDVAFRAPSLALAVALFVIVLFGLLYKPRAPGHSIYAIVPREYHDIIRRLDERTASVLYSLYVIQALTAVATFVVAVVLFWALGYAAPVWLGLFAGILQFIPIVGPSVLVVGLATLDVAVLDMPLRAVAVLVLGLLFVAMAPDVTIRPKLASRTGDFSSTLYFVGFVGGLLTLGAVGIIVGPLVVALLVEVLDIIAEEGSDGDGKDGGGLGGGETDSGGEGPEANPENPEREVPT